MRNLFRYFAPGFSFFACLLMAGVTALAQAPYEVVNGIAFSKNAIDNHDGTYTIDLEAFVLGTVSSGAKPSDIGLVLDLSGSMQDPAGDGTYIHPGKISYSLVNSKQCDKNSLTGFSYYYKDNGRYYKLSAGQHYYYKPNSSDRQSRYYIYYTKGGVDYYLGANGADAVTMWNNERWTADGISHSMEYTTGTTLWNLDNVYRTMDKLELLKDAATKFVNIIDENNPSSGPSHMVSIVSFETGSKVEKDFVSITEGKNSLISAIEAMRLGGQTSTDQGVSTSIGLFNNLQGRDDCPNYMVVFTDGSPGTSSFDNTVANSAILTAKGFKATGKVYTIGLINNPGENVRNFLNYLSSNYPAATSMDNPGVADQQGGYYFPAQGSNLASIFEDIAQQATAANTQVTAESTVTVDVVTTSFNAPSNPDEVTVLVAKCKGRDENGYLTFFDPTTPEAAGLPSITVNPITDNTVSTTGFDYTANFCGEDGAGGFKGYKQIIRFLISTTDSAVGGPSVATNDPSSGIYINNTQLAPFNIPHVKVPVQIWIEKRGLVGNDSAVFTIYYSKNANGPWTHFTKVIINNSIELKSSAGFPMVKVTGLDPDNFYRIKEDAWSWSYTVDNPIRYTSETISNPFVFVNTPTGVKENEDGIRNVFNNPASE